MVMQLPGAAVDVAYDEQREWEQALAAAQADLGDVNVGQAPQDESGILAALQLAAMQAQGATGDTSELEMRAKAGEKFKGVLRRYDVAQARGFITCADVKAVMDKDVYVHGNVIIASGARVGDAIEFGLHFNTQGLPQASAPCTLLERAGGMAAGPGEFKGTIKSFSASTGYGFLNCPEIKEAYGRDAFLGYDKAVGFYVGQEVIFTVSLNKDQMPVVLDMHAADPTEAMAAKGKDGCKGDGKGGKMAMMAAMAQAKGMGMAKGGGWAGAEAGLAAGPGEFKGTIKSFSASAGYGFIECPEIKEAYGRDAFLGYDKAVGFYVGQEVTFDVSLNKDQMPVVSDMHAADPTEAMAAKGKDGGKGDGKGKMAMMAAMAQAKGMAKGGGWAGAEGGGWGGAKGGWAGGADGCSGKAAMMQAAMAGKGQGMAMGGAMGAAPAVDDMAAENKMLRDRLARIEAALGSMAGVEESAAPAAKVRRTFE